MNTIEYYVRSGKYPANYIEREFFALLSMKEKEAILSGFASVIRIEQGEPVLYLKARVGWQRYSWDSYKRMYNPTNLVSDAHVSEHKGYLFAPHPLTTPAYQENAAYVRHRIIDNQEF